MMGEIYEYLGRLFIIVLENFGTFQNFQDSVCVLTMVIDVLMHRCRAVYHF